MIYFIKSESGHVKIGYSKIGAVDPKLKEEIDWIRRTIEIYTQRTGAVGPFWDRHWCYQINELAKRI